MPTETIAKLSPEMLDALIEKSIAKKVVYRDGWMSKLPISYCPSCDEHIDMYAYGRGDMVQGYCPYCGQALDWT